MGTYYISPTGNDTTGAGTLLSPWKTLYKASTVALLSTDIIYCLAGTYQGFRGSSLSSAISIKAQVYGVSPLTTIFDFTGVGVGNNVIADLYNGGSLKSLSIKNILPTAPTWHVFFSMNSVSGTFTVDNCLFDTINAQYAGSQYWGLLGFNVYRYIANATLTIRGTIFRNVKAIVGCSFQGGVSPINSRVNVYGCSIYNSVGYEAVPFRTHAFVGTGFTIDLKNNIIVNATGTTYEIAALASGDTFTTSYNCARGFTTPLSGTGDISSDPLFVDPANGDFRLRPGSPCIDTGTLL